MTRAKLLEISPGELYQRGQFIGMKLDDKLALLDRYGVDVVVNFWHKYDEELAPHVWLYLHYYFHDSEREMDGEWLLYKAEQLANFIDDGHVVLVHCYGGNNRSGIMSALVMRELYEMTGKDALDHVRGVKSRALHNKLYAEFLTNLGYIEDKI